MMPFDSYPEGGKKLLGLLLQGGGTRQTRAPMLMRKTGHTTCAYCGMDFTGSFTNWLQLQLDHVVPQNACTELGVLYEWAWDYTNRVLACKSCNEFDNHYTPPSEFKEDYIKSVKACTACNGFPDAKCRKCLDAFYILRDRIFPDRNERIRKSREAEEEEVFKRRPWEQSS